MVPSTIGPFEIISSLGGGVHGTVYRARHVGHGRVIVLKQLSVTVTDDSEEFVRLVSEVARLREVVSNHVVTTHSVELIDGRPVIETESLGESLENVLAKEALTLTDALRAVRDMLSGLKALHAAGIMHGNLRPSNVLRDTTTGNWKLADGGVTAIESETAATLLAASLLYAAPEVLTRRADTGERADLYSVGMIGLQAALGTARLKEAFPDVSNLNSPSRWLTWIESSADEAVPLHVLSPGTPEPASRFLSRLLSKDPAARFPSAIAALGELEEILPAGSVPPAGPSLEARAAPGVTPRATPAARLLISGPGGFKQEVALSGRTYRLGRDPQNEIVLPDETKAVSRVHAELKCDAGRYLLNDLDSQNGLLVGGRRKTSVQLQPGVAVKIGEYTLTLSAGPAASGVRTTQTKPAAKALRDYVAGAASQIAALWPPKTASQWATVVGIPLLAIIGLVWIASRDSTSDDQTRVERQEDPSVPETTTTIPPEPSAREKSLAAIRKLLEGKDFAAAAREAEQLLTLNPQDPEALALRDEANAGLRRPDPPTPPPTDAKKPTASARSARGSKPPPPPVYQPVIPRRAGETEADWFARDRRLTATAASAMQAMDAGDAAAALKLWRSIQSEEPGYPGLDAHIAAARARLSQAAQAAIQTARALEKSGDLPGARDSLRRARELDPESTAAQAALDALADRMRKEGERAFRDGQDFENYQKLAEARQAYQKAFDYLPDGHADKKRARAALDRIRK